MSVETLKAEKRQLLTISDAVELHAHCVRRQTGAKSGAIRAILKMPASVQRMNFRLTLDILTAVDAACERRAGTVSRNTWIAETVAEKLARED